MEENRTIEEVYEEPTVIFIEKDPLTKWIWACFIGSVVLFMMAGCLV